MKFVLFAILSLLSSGVIAQPDTLFREGFEQPCKFLPAPLIGVLPIPYESYAGVPFGTNHTWTWGNASNLYVREELVSVGVKGYSFVAPLAGQEKRINFPSSTGGIAASISTQCGNFNVPSTCIGVASSSISWSTNPMPPAFRCKLEPGQLYYLSFAWFNYPAYLQGGGVQSTCECPGPNCSCSGSNCTATCQYGNNATP